MTSAPNPARDAIVAETEKVFKELEFARAAFDAVRFSYEEACFRFGRSVAALRSDRKVSLRKLGQMIKVTPQYINLIETGKNLPTKEMVAKLKKALL